MSAFNSSVKKVIVDEVCAKENSGYTEKQVRGIATDKMVMICFVHLPVCTCIAAVQRKYESLRWPWRVDEDDTRKELMKAISKKKKYRARRKMAISLLSLQFYCSCMSTIFIRSWYAFIGCPAKWDGEVEADIHWIYVRRVWWHRRRADNYFTSAAVEIKTFVASYFVITIATVTVTTIIFTGLTDFL